ncbi:MAG: M15 family metallopeptidase [Alkalispirochaetaceae bacterium]
MKLLDCEGARLCLIALPLSVLLLSCAPSDGGSPGTDSSPPRQTVPAAEQRESLHPRFDLSREQLAQIAGLAPSSSGEAILAEPQRFLDLAAQMLRSEPELLLLVDKSTPLEPDYEPDDLVALEEYGEALLLRREGLSLRRLIMDDLLAMVEAAEAEGIELLISSTYRSYEYQEWLFDYWVEELGLEEAQRSSARPGTSEHQLGTTVDFGTITAAFARTEAGRWLAEHAGEYGFSLSYPDGYEEVTGYKYEPWHFRYIGRSAVEMHQRYFDGVQQRMLEFWQQAKAPLAEAYRGSAGEPGIPEDGE